MEPVNPFGSSAFVVLSNKEKWRDLVHEGRLRLLKI